jgi:hypothetical protein
MDQQIVRQKIEQGFIQISWNDVAPLLVMHWAQTCTLVRAG